MLKGITGLFESWSGEDILGIDGLTQAGSNRHYFRLRTEGRSVVACYGENEQENNAFVALADHFHKQHLNVPQVYTISKDRKYYLQQDLGDISLFKLIEEGRTTGKFSEMEKNLLHTTIAELPNIQYLGGQGLDYSVCYPQQQFNRYTILWDLNYFKYYFLKPVLGEFDEVKLEQDFDSFASYVCSEENSCFLYRDFQSRNVMWHDDKPYFIDFQGGRKGVPYYDVASFLYQAKANFSDDLRAELLDTYFQSASQYVKFSSKDFKQKLQLFALLRSLQTLGAYGYRGYFERKAHFLQSVTPAIANLSRMLDSTFPKGLNISYLLKLLGQLVEKQTAQTKVLSNTLRVRVSSFSYLKGIPEDYTGNGGGFVFDCRSILNPGQQDKYKLLTGLDREVIEFIEQNDQMKDFLNNAYDLVDNAVERYLHRGFKSLMVNFGCTGGQHRSVYAAQHIAEHLHKKFPNIEIHLNHREQRIVEDFG